MRGGKAGCPARALDRSGCRSIEREGPQAGRLVTLPPQRSPYVKQLSCGALHAQEQRSMVALQLRALRVLQYLRRAGGRQRASGQAAPCLEARRVQRRRAATSGHSRPDWVAWAGSFQGGICSAL